jgi:protocatechuate 3,4-dioxygenase beta subunit
MRNRVDTVRRRLVVSGCSLATGFPLRAAWAGRLATPAQAQGPFYPLALPLDRDNDLVTVSGLPGRARGVVTDVAGRIADPDGRPLRGVRVEIWQVNAFGRYHHPHDDQDRPVDPHFQGYGSTVTDDAGGYRFRTIRPVAYPGRAPHIHFAVTGPGWGPFHTQMYVAGAPENATDFLLNSVRDRSARESLIVRLGPSPNAGSTLAGVFEIVMGSALLSSRP